MQVWLNGQFVDHEHAQVPVFDAGFQHAVGLFETMLARNGRIFRPQRHIERLAASARQLLLTERLRAEPLIEALERTLAESGLAAARMRLTVTGGDLSRLQSHGESTVDPTLLIVAQPPTPYPDEFFTRGVLVTICESRANPYSATSGHKSLAYWERIRALQLAGSVGASESLWLNITNHLASGSVSNVFLVKDDVLLTPIARGEEAEDTMAAPVLPGVTRAAITEIAERQGRTVTRRMLDVNDLLGADEVFLTNSSWGVLPVVQVERQGIGAGEPGPVTMDLRTAWQELVESETTVPHEA